MLEERWFGHCEGCGHMTTVVIGDEAQVSNQPLEDFLVSAPIQRERPPWLRFFQISSRWPSNVRWHYTHHQCDDCSASVTFGARFLAPRYPAVSLCLNCGSTAVAYYSRNEETPRAIIEGRDWSPMCPAVRKARRLAFARRPHFPIPDAE